MGPMVTARLKCFNYLHIDAENKVAIRVKFEREFWLFLQLVNSISMHNKVGRPKKYKESLIRIGVME